ncbi:C-type lectin lectoxin-Lio2-like [Patiria miniata]|uniref:C-type lectin domain-containing protein n=1 Tax=Patiria miniata TaxID=46514 RepID=A0A913ZNU9_PATMI|nr:C-type lectin lectoxin-Lio2-like [Patiria miniata]
MKVLLITTSVLLLAGTAVSAWGGTGPKCPNGWHMYNNTQCLSLFTRQEPWEEARRQCDFKTSGSDLVIIDSAEKNAFVNTLVHSKPPLISCGLLGIDSYWIGLNDRRREFWFEWNDTQERGEYRNWGFLEPNNLLGEDCVEMEYDKGKWNDEDCDSKRCFVCEVAAT